MLHKLFNLLGFVIVFLIFIAILPWYFFIVIFLLQPFISLLPIFLLLILFIVSSPGLFSLIFAIVILSIANLIQYTYSPYIASGQQVRIYKPYD